MGGEVFSVRRVSDYLSSHIDLDDRIRTDMGCTQRDDGPNEVRNHHAPLTPRSTQSTGLLKRARVQYVRSRKELEYSLTLRTLDTNAANPVAINRYQYVRFLLPACVVSQCQRDQH